MNEFVEPQYHGHKIIFLSFRIQGSVNTHICEHPLGKHWELLILLWSIDRVLPYICIHVRLYFAHCAHTCVCVCLLSGANRTCMNYMCSSCWFFNRQYPQAAQFVYNNSCLASLGEKALSISNHHPYLNSLKAWKTPTSPWSLSSKHMTQMEHVIYTVNN